MRSRLILPGCSRPDVFARGRVPGGVGQYVLEDHRFDRIGEPKSQDRFGWAVDDIASSCVFDWNIVDGLFPYVGTQLGIPAGSIYSRVSPWRTRNREAINMVAASATAYLTTYATDPPDTHDIVVMVLMKVRTTTTRTWFATYQPAPCSQLGFVIWSLNGQVFLYTKGTTGGAVWGGGACAPGCHELVIGAIKRGGNQRFYIGGELADTRAASTGSYIGGDPLSINAYSNGVNVGESDITRIMFFYGVGIADLITDELARDIRASVFGLTSESGSHARYSRASARAVYPTGPTGIVDIVGCHTPPSGNSEGLGPDEQIVSVTSRNHDFLAGDTALIQADAGLTVSLANDSANLGDLIRITNGGYVIRIQNPTGGPLRARLGNAIGSTSVCWNSIRARVAAGTIKMGWHTAAGAFTQTVASLSSGYARSAATAAPALVTDLQALEIPASGDVYIVLWCAGVGARIPDEVPSYSNAGVSSTVAQGVVTTQHVPEDTLGTIEVDACPRWNGASGTGTRDLVVSRTTGAPDTLVLDDSTQKLESDDGTNTASANITEADGVEETYRVSWGDQGLYAAQIDGSDDTQSFDGAPDGSDALTLRGTSRAIRKLQVLRNQRARVEA